MICVLSTPIDLANYMEVYNIRNRYPNESVSHIDWADFSKMKTDETLYLLAHGSGTTIEDMKADELAKLLVDKGLKKPIRKIKLVACSSGIKNVTTKIVPYCQLLADEIVDKKGPRTLVIGFDGMTAVTDDLGITFAKDKSQSSYPNWSDFVNNHQKKLDKWDAHAKKLKYDNQKMIVDNANALAKQKEVQDAFEWLYENNEKYTKPSIIGKTYGIPGQKIY